MNWLIVIGCTLAAGIWLVFLSAKAARSIDFSERIAPYMRSSELKSTLLEETTFNKQGIWGGLYQLALPFVTDALNRFSLGTASGAALERRLEQAHEGKTVADFRAEQIVWALASFAFSIFLVSIAAYQGRTSLVAGAALSIACGIAGFIGRDWWLSQSIQRREKQMLAEFPALAELMALSVTAGESAVNALERVCRVSNGELSTEFKKILAQTRSGDGLVPALQDFSQRTSVTALSRFVDGIVVAVERGTPLSDVLRAQAQDVRDVAKRELMETAGKKEIAMMVPVVFFILPLTVVFAVFPGISLLQLDF
ncbi:type II secretion system F family protein [Rothia sp. ZJ1223]|uniref:type II secretion system F family protein n=1 Tax=Rothia sp. ZJ1223 TaxID=2811098 RepID=UPI0019577CA0|nr:type II secretion system F family protein [Rothia sp. ZJ1223]MBM7051038.1 type II secretion system F family protein [Rothia sp. ZJ1223]